MILNHPRIVGSVLLASLTVSQREHLSTHLSLSKSLLFAVFMRIRVWILRKTAIINVVLIPIV